MTEELPEKIRQVYEELKATMVGSGIQPHRMPTAAVISFLGLVGSGKSSVARELAPLIGAIIIQSDAIRVVLRKAGEPYKWVRPIAQMLAGVVLSNGGSVIFDADVSDDAKLKEAREAAKADGVRFHLIHVHADPTVMIYRMLNSPQEEFFMGAKKSLQQGNETEHGMVMKFHEFWRRTPHHYLWVNEGGGRWELIDKSASYSIDTSDSVLWRKKIAEIADNLIVGQFE